MVNQMMETEKMETENLNQNAKTERPPWDGTCRRVRSWGYWPDRIIAIMGGKEKNGRKLWFNHIQLVKTFKDMGYDDLPVQFSPILRLLVVEGYLERARAPEFMRYGKFNDRNEYIYRRTSKPYDGRVYGKGMSEKHKAAMLKAYRTFDVNRKLPAWFRAMMN